MKVILINILPGHPNIVANLAANAQQSESTLMTVHILV